MTFADVHRTKKSWNRLLVLMMFGLVVASVMTIWLVLLHKQPGVTAVNISAIQVGMTYTEVESLMGCPSGTLPPNASNQVSYRNLPESFVIAPYGRRGAGHDWTGRKAAVFVIFDASGQVEEVIPYAVGQITPRPWWQIW